MRTELQQLETIERYLNNNMGQAEALAFEAAMANNPVLQNQVSITAHLKSAIIRRRLKTDIQKYTPKKGLRLTKWTTILSAIVLGVALSHFFLSKKDKISEITKNTGAELNLSLQNVTDDTLNPTDSDTTKYEVAKEIRTSPKTNPANQTIFKRSPNLERDNKLKTWLNPEVQTFSINPLQGATLEGKDGSLIIVPKNAFVDKNGQLIQQPVTMEVIEALKISDMIAYNLTTTSNGKALSSGGMIYMQPYSLGEQVNINPNAPLYIEIPTDNYQTNMQSWHGVVDNNGDVNWESPKDLEKFLVRVDLDLLDFLPPGFEEAVHAGMPFRKHETASKKLIDSLYYALENEGIIEKSNEEIMAVDGKEIYFYENVKEKKKKPTPLPNKNSASEKQHKTTELCYINPLKVKTIKTEYYTHTFIATREFESRLRAVHTISEADDLLDLYVKNLNKNLWEVDLMVVNKLNGENRKTFENFADARLTNLNKTNIYENQLHDYYDAKLREFQKNSLEQHQIYLKKNQAELEATNKDLKNLRQKLASIEFKKASLQAQMNVFTGNETTLNIGRISQSRTSNKTNVVNASAVYATTWYEPGWMNIDMYLKSIEQNPVEVEIWVNNNQNSGENVKIYQCINSLKTIIPLRQEYNKCNAKFPNETHKEAEQASTTYALGLKWDENGEILFAEQAYNPYKEKTITLQWKKIATDALKEQLAVFDFCENLLTQVNKQEKILEKAQAYSQQAAQTKAKIAQAQVNYADTQKRVQAEREFMRILVESISCCYPINKKVSTIDEPTNVIPGIPLREE